MFKLFKKKKLEIVKLPSTLPSKAGNLEYKQVLKEKKQPRSMHSLTAKKRNSMLLFMQSSQKIVYIATCHFCHVPNGFYSIYRNVHLVLNWSWNCWCLLPRVGLAQMWLCAWHKIRQGERTSRKACLPCHSEQFQLCQLHRFALAGRQEHFWVSFGPYWPNPPN